MHLSSLVTCLFLACSLGAIRVAQADPSAVTDKGTDEAPATGHKTAPRQGLDLCARHYQAGEHALARDCFARHLSRGGQSAPLLFALGYCHYRLGEHAQAERRFREAAALAPTDGDAGFMWALALAQLGRHGEALATLRRAMTLGLDSEDPAEARRTLRLLERLVATRPKRGWIYRLGARVGYDSRPRLEGAAAVAGASDAEDTSPSAVFTLEAALGHRFLHGHWGSTTLSYGFHQRLVLSDALFRGSTSAGRFGDPAPELSLQVHRLGVELRTAGRLVSGGLRVGGELELTGLRRFGPLLAAVPLEGALRLGWHRLTDTRLTLGGIWQWAIDPAVTYLGGGGLVLGLEENLHWRRVTGQLRYALSSWWLGTASQTLADCPAHDPCILSAPFSHLAHRLRLALEVRCTTWLTAAVDLGLGHRTYRPEGRYRPLGGQEVSLTRVDLTHDYRAALRFRLREGLILELGYHFAANHSTVNQETAGVEEGYLRHVVDLGLRFERW